MLSHTDGMIGGETFIKRGDGLVTKVEGPRYGHAYIIQGGILGRYCTKIYPDEVSLTRDNRASGFQGQGYQGENCERGVLPCQR
jgi:hypothetical protein